MHVTHIRVSGVLHLELGWYRGIFRPFVFEGAFFMPIRACPEYYLERNR